MKQRLKQYFLIALAAAALYFVLDNHFILKKNRFYLLQKTTLNLHDTFVSLDNKRPETIMESEDPWKDIVAFFGEQVLNKDQTLDRDKLREIVFKDLEKKKKLESFQHPRIGEEFIKLVKQYADEDPEAIIQVVVPLLIEVNMHPLFHNLLMVYATEEEQKKRLMERDGSTEEMAMNMIRSQLSVEEKKGFCDLVIDNSGSLDETRRQVEALWKKLKQIQQSGASK